MATAALVAILALPAHAGSILAELRADPIAAREAARIAVAAAKARLDGRAIPALRTTSQVLGRPGGAFVTAVRHGKVRGCWGSATATEPRLAQEIAKAAARAMDADYRHRPINPREWGQLRLIVSVVGPLHRLGPGERPDPSREGLLVTNGSRGGVLLPGEARSAHYQRAECLRKAGIGPGQPATSFRFETWTIEAAAGIAPLAGAAGAVPPRPTHIEAAAGIAPLAGAAGAVPPRPNQFKIATGKRP